MLLNMCNFYGLLLLQNSTRGIMTEVKKVFVETKYYTDFYMGYKSIIVILNDIIIMILNLKKSHQKHSHNITFIYLFLNNGSDRR